MLQFLPDDVVDEVEMFAIRNVVVRTVVILPCESFAERRRVCIRASTKDEKQRLMADSNFALPSGGVEGQLVPSGRGGPWLPILWFRPHSWVFDNRGGAV